MHYSKLLPKMDSSYVSLAKGKPSKVVTMPGRWLRNFGTWKRMGDWTTLCPSCLKDAQYLRLYRLWRLSRCRFHNRPYNLHLGVHVTRRKKCALFFLSVTASDHAASPGAPTLCRPTPARPVHWCAPVVC